MKSLYRLSMEDQLIKEDVNYTVQDAIELATIEQENEAACDAVEDSIEATAMLTDRLTINSKLSADPATVTEEMVQASNECLAYCLGKLNVDSRTFEQIRVSRESGDTPAERLQISTEGIGKIVKKVFKAIGDIIKWIWRTIVGFFKAILKLFGFYKSKKKKKKKQQEYTSKELKSINKDIVSSVNNKLTTDQAGVEQKVDDAESQLMEGTSRFNVSSCSVNDFKQLVDNYTKVLDKFGDFKNMSDEDWAEYLSYTFALAKIMNYENGTKKYGFLTPLCVNESIPSVNTISSVNKAIKDAAYPIYIKNSVSYYSALFDINFEGSDNMTDSQKEHIINELSKYEADAFSKFYYACGRKHFNIRDSLDGVLFLTGINLTDHNVKFKYYSREDDNVLTEIKESVADVDYIELGESKYVSFSHIIENVNQNYYKQIEEAVTFDIDTSKAEKEIDGVLNKLNKQYQFLRSKITNNKDELNARPYDPVEAYAWDRSVIEMNSYSKLVNGLQSSTTGMMHYYKFSADILSVYVDLVGVGLRLKEIEDTFDIPSELLAKYNIQRG